MKHCLLRGILSSSFLLLFSCFLFAQNSVNFFKEIPQLDKNTPDWALSMYSDNPNVELVESAYNAYFLTRPFEKTIHTQNYKHWMRVIDELVNDEGFIVQLTDEELALKHEANRALRNESSFNRSAIWKNVGPNNTYNNDGSLNTRPTQANVYCLAAAPSDSTLLYCGTESGGFFKSTDHGLTWSLTTLNETFTNGADVKIHPTNPDIVYIATGDDIYKTVDGGLTWVHNKDFSSTIEQLYIHATSPNKVFAATRDGLYYTDDNGSTWTDIRAGWHWDIVANPLNPNTY